MKQRLLAMVLGGTLFFSSSQFVYAADDQRMGSPGWISSGLRILNGSQGSSDQIRTGTVQASVVNIRSGPGTAYSISATVSKGERLPILKSLGGWSQVRLVDGRTGWIAGWLLEVDVPQASISTGGWTVTTQFAANIRKGPGTTFDIIRTSGVGEVFELGKVQDSWYELFKGGTLVGWVASWLVTAQGPAQGSSGKNDRLPREVSRGASSAPTGNQISKGLAGKTIVVDPGHGNFNLKWNVIDRGASGPNGTLEKDIVLDISHRLSNYLTAKGARIIMTRTGDGDIRTDNDLQYRADIANNSKADLFVSIHVNAHPNAEIGGTSTHYCALNEGMPSSQKGSRVRIASMVQQSLVSALGRRDIGILEENFAVLRETKQPSILVEVMFVSNPEEEKLLNLEMIRDKTAAAIAQGVQRHFEQP